MENKDGRLIKETKQASFDQASYLDWFASLNYERIILEIPDSKKGRDGTANITSSQKGQCRSR